MEIAKLKRIGFSETESKIYFVLLELGKAQAGEISKKSQVNRTTTYDALERLIKKGFVKYSVEANKKVFKPVSPDKIIEYMREQEKIAEDILPNLKKMYKSSKDKEEFEVYQGRKGIRSILLDILKYKEYVAYGSRGLFLEIMKHDFVAFQNRKKELKIKARVVINESSRKSESIKVAYGKFKFIPDEYTGPSTTFVYGNYVAVMIWGENPTAMVIKSKGIAESYKNYFEFLWKTAKG